MCETCQACAGHVQEVVRKLQFGQARTPEEVRKLEETISGRESPATGLTNRTVDEHLLQGGEINQELARQAMFEYSRNRAGERVPVEMVVREQAREIFAQGSPQGTSCSQCGCQWS